MTIRSLRKECAQYITEKAIKNKDIFALEGDLAEATQSILFKRSIPERYLEMGIAEQNMVGVAAGLSTCRKIPIVFSFACFISMRTCEQIRTTVCYPKLNVKFLVTHAGVSAGSAGTTHHAIEDIAIMRSLPNMRVMAPGDVLEMQGVIDAALSYDGPVYIRIAKEDVEDVFDRGYKFEIGEAIVPVEGSDGTIITTGTMLSIGVKAAEVLLKKHKISARLLHCASIKPIDRNKVVEAAYETKNIITVEEHSVIGGLGSAVSEIVAELGVGKVCRIGINDHFCDIGTQPYLLSKEGLDVDSIVNKALSWRT